MLNNYGFDLWADHYDKTVQISEEKNEYPFAGYKMILNNIYNEIMQKKQSSVLDIGVGTGVLAGKLYENEHSITGIDFSSKMISIAQSKMPAAHFIEWDISNDLPSEIAGNKYDFIVSTYTLHHLTDDAKISFITNMLSFLKEDGKILIGDISFKTREELEQCRNNNIDHWDDDEYYFVASEITSTLKQICQSNFLPVSHCGGVFIITK